MFLCETFDPTNTSKKGTLLIIKYLIKKLVLKLFLDLKILLKKEIILFLKNKMFSGQTCIPITNVLSFLIYQIFVLRELLAKEKKFVF